MTPKTKFNRDEIIEAAYQIACTEGLAAVSARRVAASLGCSVAPIYVNFTALDDLHQAVVERVFAMTESLLASQSGPNLFENIGRASLAFARKYPILARELILQPNPYMRSYVQTENSLLEALKDDPYLAGLSFADRQRLFLKMQICQVGLMSMIANNRLPEWFDPDQADELYMEIGDELVRSRKSQVKEAKK